MTCRCGDRTLCFFFNDTATTEIYTLSLHDALPISGLGFTFAPTATADFLNATDFYCEKLAPGVLVLTLGPLTNIALAMRSEEHTSEPSHANISYAVFCLKKKSPL